MEDKYTLKFTKKASQDYEQIYQYISQDLYAPQAADNLLKKMENSIRQLCTTPFIGSCVQDSYLMQKGYRRIVVDNYIVFYIVNETEMALYIMRILYSGRDYAKYLWK